MKIIERIIAAIIILFSLALLAEVVANYYVYANWHVFPIKNANSYGYIYRKSGKVLIPLDKYSTRLKAQLMLPIAILSSLVNNKELYPIYNPDIKKYGYVDKHKNLILDYKFESAEEFNQDFAIVSIKVNNEIKFGSIDKDGKWIIEPKYSYLCTNYKYYTKACLDNKHCGAIDRFGNQLTKLTYTMDKLDCKGDECREMLCKIGNNKFNYCK